MASDMTVVVMNKNNERRLLRTSSVRRGIQIHRLSSWSEFDDFIRSKHSNCPALVYRGQANAQWRITSTLDRLENLIPKRKNFSGGSPEHFDCTPVGRDTHIRAYQESVRGFSRVGDRDLKPDEWWALGQQHGLATPLVDWTYSPYVALFFAFENENCFTRNSTLAKARNRAIFSLSTSMIPSTASIDELERESTVAAVTNDVWFRSYRFPVPRLVVARRPVGYRQDSQATVFLGMPCKKNLEEYVSSRFTGETEDPHNLHAQPVLQKIIIPNIGRLDCLKWLNKMNIHRRSLFPDHDGAARYINALWELDFDTSLGYLP